MLVHELRAVMNSNGYVNARHTALLADVMTHRGDLQPITRHGGHKHDSVLKQATFESSVRALVTGACRGALDPVSGASANLLLGQAVPAGTGLHSRLFLDTAKCVGGARRDAGARTRICVTEAAPAADSKENSSGSPFARPSADPLESTGDHSPFSPAAHVVGGIEAVQEAPIDCMSYFSPLVCSDDNTSACSATFSPIVEAEPPVKKRKRVPVAEVQRHTDRAALILQQPKRPRVPIVKSNDKFIFQV